MIAALRRLLGGLKPAQSAAELDLPRPDHPVAVIGDIHGRADLLAAILDKIAQTCGDSTRIVTVGDYVDRGDHSRDVLETLFQMQTSNPARMTCLTGNHELMLLEFLDDPVAFGPRWLCNGGLQTLASYGVAGVSEFAPEPALKAASEELRGKLGDDLAGWLRALPVFWMSGNVAVVHAGANPTRSIEEQSHETLCWGHPDFHKRPRPDARWVVHGHTIVGTPTAANGRIAVDTGAYATGRLSATCLNPDGAVEFLST